MNLVDAAAYDRGQFWFYYLKPMNSAGRSPSVIAIRPPQKVSIAHSIHNTDKYHQI